MGDVKEFKPRKPKDDELYQLMCTECGNRTWVIESEGAFVCAACDSWTSVELELDGFFTSTTGES